MPLAALLGPALMKTLPDFQVTKVHTNLQSKYFTAVKHSSALRKQDGIFIIEPYLSK